MTSSSVAYARRSFIQTVRPCRTRGGRQGRGAAHSRGTFLPYFFFFFAAFFFATDSPPPSKRLALGRMLRTAAGSCQVQNPTCGGLSAPNTPDVGDRER